ncbi:hypothetical protein FR932_00890 [Moritella marina ATCC 15381]|uniref:DUF6314 domain-containing protein n=1 Tax=Moritella marina ATCC 15381 TaxID=1202962 RepID=A0A5J6WF27_MORMI|nr:DUF6314 family protein [Moritella marina]QFI36479.1 hypothetical protein FR932_00890 [Moritella marina ATCC 15381]
MTVQTLTQLWFLLNRLNRFSFKVNSDNESVTGWQGEGQGLIKRRAGETVDKGNTDVPESGAIVETIERGDYHVSATRKVPMHNQYLWQFQGDHIRLTHLRFGWDKPVFLFDIIENEQGQLVTRQSHQCAADNYDASFVLHPDSLEMQWRIQGPKKREVLDYIYAV